MTVTVAASKKRVRSDAAAKLAAFAFCRADLLVELNHNLRIEFTSSARANGSWSDEMLRRGALFPDLVGEEDRSRLVETLQGLDGGGRVIDCHLQLALGGDPVECQMSGYRVPDFANHYFLAIKFRPSRVAKPTADGSRRDVESGTLERESFRTAAAQRIQQLQASGAGTAFSLIRIDDLETIRQNLTEEGYGKLLGKVGATLKRLSVDQDTVGRISEDSFGLLHDKSHDEGEIRERLSQASDGVLGRAHGLATSIETVDVGDRALSETEVANVLSFTIRRFVRGKVKTGEKALSTVLDEMATENVKVVQMFKRICGTREFDFVFMPICDLRSGATHHYEILSRFAKLEGTGISTFDMMSLAEEVGVISDFDLAAARKTIKLIGDMSKGLGTAMPGSLRGMAEKLALPTLALNISGSSILNDAFVKELIGMLRAVSNLSKNLSFEITESAEIVDLEKANANIQKLRDMRFSVALDDFGAGAASFDYLNVLKVDVVKFDGPVVRRALATDLGKDFLASMASLCTRSNIKTVAEMVEDESMAANLLGFGIDYGQGYHFGKPSPEFPTGL